LVVPEYPTTRTQQQFFRNVANYFWWAEFAINMESTAFLYNIENDTTMKTAKQNG
jgi:hypothetical protein